MKVLNEYPTHHYIEEYEKVDIFCVNCGRKTVFGEQSPGDYYCGPGYICVTCGCEFSLQGPNDASEKILDQLRSGKTLSPSTPEGN